MAFGLRDWWYAPRLVVLLALLANRRNLVGFAQAGHTPLLMLQACNNMPGALAHSQELLVAGQLVLCIWTPDIVCPPPLASCQPPPGRLSIHSGLLGGLLPASPRSVGRSHEVDKLLGPLGDT